MAANIVSISSKEGETIEEEWNYYSKSPFQVKIEYLKPYKRFLALNKDKSTEYLPDKKEARITDLSKYDDDKKADFYEGAISRVNIDGLKLGYVEKGTVNIKGVKYQGYDALVIEGKNPNKYLIWIDINYDALLKYVVLDKDDSTIFSSTGSDFKVFDKKFLLPQRIDVEIKDSNDGKPIKKELHLNNLKVNENIDDSVFELKLPNDVKISK